MGKFIASEAEQMLPEAEKSKATLNRLTATPADLGQLEVANRYTNPISPALLDAFAHRRAVPRSHTFFPPPSTSASENSRRFSRQFAVAAAAKSVPTPLQELSASVLPSANPSGASLRLVAWAILVGSNFVHLYPSQSNQPACRIDFLPANILLFTEHSEEDTSSPLNLTVIRAFFFLITYLLFWYDFTSISYLSPTVVDLK
ncbi:hypothetical protein Aperf_G00000018787 [Anoplocephala perfoliata]